MSNISLNWEEIEAEAASNKQYKDYAPNGEYKVKVAEVKQNTNGNGWFDFIIDDTGYKFPKLSFAFFGDAKLKYRAHYYKEVMKLLGATEEQARKAVEVCESKGTRSDVHKAYTDAFAKLAKKHLTFPVEVRDQYDRDGNPMRSEQGTIYGETVFHKATGLQFPSNGTKKNVAEDNDPMAGAEEVDLTEAEFPF